MDKRIIFSFLLLGFVTLVGAGCGEQETAEEATTPAAGEQEEELSLDEVLAKAQDLEGYKFDIRVTSSERKTAMTSKMWMKGGNMRWEGNVEGQQVVYLINTADQIAYVYMPSQSMAFQQDISQAKEAMVEPPDEQSSEISKQSPTVIGTEVWDGKNCLVVEGVSDKGDETKWWLWTKYGIPVKTELVSNSGEFIATELYDIEVGDIEDSIFELPAGVQPTQYPGL